jgi:hypothetical protein
LIPVFLVLPDVSVDPGYIFARKCVLQCFARGEAPLFMGLSYDGVLDLTDEREQNMAALASTVWMQFAKVVCYTDLRISPKMLAVLDFAKRSKLPIEFRRLAGGRPSSEGLHFQGIPHSEENCALCLGPRRWAELQAEIASASKK